MWLDYIRERMPHKQIIELEQGFAIYYPLEHQNCMYLEDIYVRKEYRKTNVGTEMLKMVESEAKEQGMEYILGSCAPDTVGATISMKAMFARGFELHGIENDLILLRRRI